MSTAALYSRTKCYFFSGDQYIRVTRGDTGAGTVDPGYPKNISTWGWGNFGQQGIDDALHSGSKCYFFAGDQYIRVTRGDTGAGTVDPGYPKNISEWGWDTFPQNGDVDLNSPGIDAALHSGSKCYFFCGDQYIRVTRGDTGAGTVDPGYPRNISAWQWGGFGQRGIDAALHSGSKCYFFSGSQYIRVTRGDTGPGTVDPGYPKNISDWEWPTGFHESWVAIGGNFSFDNAITANQRATLLGRHRFAFSQITGCGAVSNLSNAELNSLAAAYRRPIRHGLNNDPNANASAFVGQNQLFINFANLFPDGNAEIAQTLIHEMMHCAGFTHPNRRRPDQALGQSCAQPNPNLFDCPFDNGPYYSTQPLQAELCIAGDQSDLIARTLEKAADESCVVDENGLATIRRGQP